MSYRAPELLRGCLASLGRALQGRPGEARVWVVDNASGEPTVSMVRREFPWVRLIENQENRGFAAANNQAIERCRADYLLLLNPDTEISRQAIDRLAGLLDREPGAAAVGPRLLGPDGSVQVSAWRFPGVRSALASWSNLTRLLPGALARGAGLRGPEYPPGEEPRRVDWISGACLLARRAAVREVGPLDERFFMYAEETDWCKRFAEAGWAVWHQPRAEVTHRVGGSTGEEGPASLLQRTRFHRSEYLYFEKHRGRPAAVLLWCLRLLLAGSNWLRWTLQARWSGDAASRSRAARFRGSMTALWRVARGG